jgi:hypothetical protein
MITANRAGFGMGQGLSPRYAGYSCLAPIGLYWCAVVRRDRWRLAQPVAVSLATIMFIGFLTGTMDGWIAGPRWYSEKSWQAYLVYSAKYQPTSILAKLYPNPEHARIYSAALERLGLNVFADDHVRADQLTPTREAPPFAIDLVNGAPPDPAAPIAVGPEDPIVVSGWALDAGARRPARTVFLTVDGITNYPGHVGLYRPDLGGGSRRRGRRWGGFTSSIAGSVLTPGPHTIAVTIVGADGTHAFVTDPVARVVRR